MTIKDQDLRETLNAHNRTKNSMEWVILCFFLWGVFCSLYGFVRIALSYIH